MPNSFRDVLGTQVEIGDVVVYNMSGELAVGKVTDVRESGRKKNPYVHVPQLDYVVTIWNDNFYKQSKVRNTNGIIAIRGL